MAKQRYRLYALTLILITVLMCVTVYASVETSEQQLKAGFTSMFLTLRSIAVPAAAVGATATGVTIIVGNEKQAEKAKKVLLYIAVAVASIYLIPTLISFGKSLVPDVWEPGSIFSGQSG